MSYRSDGLIRVFLLLCAQSLLVLSGAAQPTQQIDCDTRASDARSCIVAQQSSTDTFGKELSISATPLHIQFDGTATVRWAASGFRQCTTRTGSEDGPPAHGNALSGAVEVNLLASTTYFLVCRDEAGKSEARSVTITVTPPPAWPPSYMAELPPDYLDRLYRVLASMHQIGRKMLRCSDNACSDSNKAEALRWSTAGFVNVMLGVSTEEVSRFFSSPKFEWPRAAPYGFLLTSIIHFRLYGLTYSRSRYMPNGISLAAQQKLESEIWAIAKANSKLADARRDVSEQHASENLHVAKVFGNFLAAQFLKDAPLYSGLKYDDGSTLLEQYLAWRDYVSSWIDYRAKRGLFVEAASPSYQSDTINAIFNIRDFAEDPVLRKKAGMLLDLIYATMAEETLLTTRGGPKSRLKDGHEYREVSDHGYDLLFNAPGRQFRPLAPRSLMTSNYYPPAVVRDLATDTDGRGIYSFKTRWPGPIKNVRDGEIPTLGWSVLDKDKSVLRTGFVTPGYIMGSAGLDPTWEYAASSSGFRWQGVVFRNNSLARIGFEVAPASLRDWHGFNPFFTMQDRNIMVTQKWLPVPPNRAWANPSYPRIYFSPTLDEVHEADGWIFARAGPAFAAVNVVSGGYVWTSPWKRDSTASKEKATFVQLNSDTAPVIMIVNQASDYDGSFEKFMSAVKREPVMQSGSTIRYATLTFPGVSRPCQTQSCALDLSPSRGYDSPFIRSVFGSGVIFIRKQRRNVVLDFRDSLNPIKVENAPLSSEFPPGFGQERPIVLSRP